MKFRQLFFINKVEFIYQMMDDVDCYVTDPVEGKYYSIYIYNKEKGRYMAKMVYEHDGSYEIVGYYKILNSAMKGCQKHFEKRALEFIYIEEK
jgi:hypothetical protein